MGVSGSRKQLSGWSFTLLVLAVFVIGVGWGMLSGHWHSALSDRDYMQLIPLLNRF